MTRRISPRAGDTAHVSIRCNNKKYYLNLSDNFFALVSWLNSLEVYYSVQLHHAVFMSNHLHLLLTPRENNLGQAMSFFLTNTAKYLNYKNDRINHVFGNRYASTIINDEKHLMNTIRYMYQNPVRALITNDVLSYPYSSLGSYLGFSNPGIFLTPDLYTKRMFNFGLEGRYEWLNWIEDIYSERELDILRKIHGRSYFKLTLKQTKEIRDNSLKIIV
ncbi:MAG: hypothetical protein ABII18_04265 [bacterium]|nr:transposase [bacterium]MBU1917481.1 transposase [bacterium]